MLYLVKGIRVRRLCSSVKLQEVMRTGKDVLLSARQGQLLTKMLASVGIDRNEVYIANILKCRPPGNRNPDQSEVDQCIGYLHRQIELISPKLICTLGGVATQSLLDVKDGITRIRGKQFDFKGCTLVPTFHPSYLLRSTHMKREAWMDMLLIKKIITEV